MPERLGEDAMGGNGGDADEGEEDPLALVRRIEETDSGETEFVGLAVGSSSITYASSERPGSDAAGRSDAAVVALGFKVLLTSVVPVVRLGLIGSRSRLGALAPRTGASLASRIVAGMYTACRKSDNVGEDWHLVGRGVVKLEGEGRL